MRAAVKFMTGPGPGQKTDEAGRWSQVEAQL